MRLASEGCVARKAHLDKVAADFDLAQVEGAIFQGQGAIDHHAVTEAFHHHGREGKGVAGVGVFDRAKDPGDFGFGPFVFWPSLSATGSSGLREGGGGAEQDEKEGHGDACGRGEVGHRRIDVWAKVLFKTRGESRIHQR